MYPGNSHNSHGVAPKFIGSRVFRTAAFGAHHPLSIVRHAAVLDIVKAFGWLDGGAYTEATAASKEKITEFHALEYVDVLEYASTGAPIDHETRVRYQVGTRENPAFVGLYERAAMTVGGAVQAAELALRGHPAFHPSGGTHHGRRDRASGFCYLNDPVFAIKTLLEHGKHRVAYVDLDIHHGDGVEAAFLEDGRVRTISIHEENRWPNTGGLGEGIEHNAFNFPVPTGFNDSELQFLLENAIIPLLSGFEADAIVLCCGADGLAGDPLSGAMLSNVALWDAIEKLVNLGHPSVILGGGGYNPWTVARYWAGLWGRLAGYGCPGLLPMVVQRILQRLECELIEDDEIDGTWLTTLEDAPNTGPVRESVREMLAVIDVSKTRTPMPVQTKQIEDIHDVA